MSVIKAHEIESINPLQSDKAQRFQEIATQIAKIVAAKNRSYGDAFGQAGQVLMLMYPDGIQPDQYVDLLGIVRVLDKLFRIANRKDAFGESPWMDILGYALLAVERESGHDDQRVG
jgi:hypothetical protein